MCGIYGMVGLGDAPLARVDKLVCMRDGLRHRGPDGDGLCRSPQAALGVTRLRVIDLDPRADQPFTDPSGRVTIAGNGEIYNAPALRRRFPEYSFRSASDVEVLVPLYLAEGPAGLAAAEGMFAVAVWDAAARRLTLARDRAGEKPLFWTRHGEEVWFASEMGALLRAGVARELHRPALAQFLQLGYVREPATPIAAIRKIPAGTIATFEAAGSTHQTYWEPWGPEAEADRRPDITVIRDLIEGAVRHQLAADVPLGVFTSGGLDSALLATLAARIVGAHRVHTFTVGFGDRGFDERPAARRLARWLGAPHHEVEVAAADLPAALEALADSGEPIADPAAIPTWVLARAARAHVTVVLTGEGGDELFGGYPTYLGHALAPRFAALPRVARSALGALARASPPLGGPVPLDLLLARFVAASHQPWPDRHAAWFGTGLPADLCPTPLRAPFPEADPAEVDVVRAALRLDYATALRERLLVKNDRATMRASLEARAPLLDPSLTRVALALPGPQQVRGGRTKRILREVARPLVPGFILRRRKHGMTAPVDAWLRGPLAAALDACEDLPRLTGGLVARDALSRLLAEQRAGRRTHGRALWALVVLRHWLGYWNLEDAA